MKVDSAQHSARALNTFLWFEQWMSIQIYVGSCRLILLSNVGLLVIAYMVDGYVLSFTLKCNV